MSKLETIQAIVRGARAAAAKQDSNLNTQQLASVASAVAQVMAQGNQVVKELAASGLPLKDIATEITKLQAVSAGQIAVGLPELAAGTKTVEQFLADNTKEAIQKKMQEVAVNNPTVRPTFETVDPKDLLTPLPESSGGGDSSDVGGGASDAGTGNTKSTRSNTTAGTGNTKSTRSNTTAGTGNTKSTRSNTTAGTGNTKSTRSNTTAGTGNTGKHPQQYKDLIFGGKGDDSLDGGVLDDSIFGGKDSDTVTGGTGNDMLCGDTGFDSFSGGDGADSLFGGKGADTIDGGEGNDSLFGGKGFDILTAASGDDLLADDSGNDTLTGGTDSDRFVLKVGSGSDFIPDFQDGIDFPGKTCCLTFEQLTITQGNSATLISLAGTNELLATLDKVNANLIGIEDFTTI